MDLKRASYTYDLIPSTFGEIGLVRRTDRGRSPICRILLPEADRPMTGKIRDVFPDAVPGRGKQDEICKQIRDFLTGDAVDIPGFFSFLIRHTGLEATGRWFSFRRFESTS